MRRIAPVLAATSMLAVACGLSLSASPGAGADADAGADAGLPVLQDARVAADTGEVGMDASVGPRLPADPGPPACGTTATTSYTIARQDRAIILDGDASDWPATVAWQAILVQNSAAPASCAEFAAVWSTEAVHLIIRVKDDGREATSNEERYFQNDSVEVMYGAATAAGDSGVFGPTDTQAIVDHRGKNLTVVGGELAPGGAGWLKDNPIEISMAGARSTAWGFLVEYKIPKERFGLGSVQLVPNSNVRVSVAASDGNGVSQTKYSFWGDALLPACVSPRPAIKYCCAGDVVRGSWCNTRQWGRLVLAP